MITNCYYYIQYKAKIIDSKVLTLLEKLRNQNFLNIYTLCSNFLNACKFSSNFMQRLKRSCTYKQFVTIFNIIHSKGPKYPKKYDNQNFLVICKSTHCVQNAKKFHEILCSGLRGVALINGPKKLYPSQLCCLGYNYQYYVNKCLMSHL